MSALQEVFKIDHKPIFKTLKGTRSKFFISQCIECWSSRFSHNLDYIFFYLVSLASQNGWFNHYWILMLAPGLFCFIWCPYCHPLASIVFTSFVQSERYVYFYDHVITGCNHFFKNAYFIDFNACPKHELRYKPDRKKVSLINH